MKNAKIIKELCLSYAMELETVQNYIAASVNLDGVRSEVIKKALAADMTVWSAPTAQGYTDFPFHPPSDCPSGAQSITGGS